MMPTPESPSPTERAIPKVLFKGKMVSGKKSNSPFFVHQRHKQSHSSRPTNDPKQPSAQNWHHPLLVKSLALFGNGFRYAFFVLIGSILLSRMITEHWMWGYNGKWARLSYYFPGPQETFTMEELSTYDGVKNQSKPLLLAINGVVYNVNANPAMYGPGGSYHHFAGKDASRAFVTGCFKTGLTFDVRGLSQKQQKSLEYWANFFENSLKYFRVGTVILPDLDKSGTPIPKDCDPKTEGGAL
ncbi:hypothetical protein PCANC_20587 [Puccinia coronata f. sp. avenae]|uniref:Cytochrome b5 heme-binding domain-containing protein n=1 Tax=Puccinia coronata f. sp. avenae TaxID=200324 RepID=A0A2N5SE79_9BASI|nr:hypothetical protein PCANC_20587 [Puccinia coronata f. sp. avenae]